MSGYVVPGGSLAVEFRVVDGEVHIVSGALSAVLCPVGHEEFGRKTGHVKLGKKALSAMDLSVLASIMPRFAVDYEAAKSGKVDRQAEYDVD
jgi:hypothetical protein